MLHNFAFKRNSIMLGICVLFLGIMVPLASFAKSATGEERAVPNSSGFSFFGDATLVKPGYHSAHAVQLNSVVPGGLNSITPPGYGGIDFKSPRGLTFAAIRNLSTGYNFTHNSCGGGSPRFQINIDGKNAFVYIGPPPNYTGCTTNLWLNTGNLATSSSYVDTSQLPGGTFYDTFTSADAKYGNAPVTGIQLVADGGWVFNDGQQTVLIDNVVINRSIYRF